VYLPSNPTIFTELMNSLWSSWYHCDFYYLRRPWHSGRWRHLIWLLRVCICSGWQYTTRNDVNKRMVSRTTV